MNEVEYIKSKLDKTERLLGLAEEALELAQAALKLRQVLDGKNPMPVTEEQAVENLLEKYGDVENYIEVILTPAQNKRAMQTRLNKRSRWVHRLKEASLSTAQYRQSRCPYCGWMWLEDCDASGYSDYCPHRGAKLRERGSTDAD